MKKQFVRPNTVYFGILNPGNIFLGFFMSPLFVFFANIPSFRVENEKKVDHRQCWEAPPFEGPKCVYPLNFLLFFLFSSFLNGDI